MTLEFRELLQRKKLEQDRGERIKLSKEIYKMAKLLLRRHRSRNTENILSRFKSIQDIQRIQRLPIKKNTDKIHPSRFTTFLSDIHSSDRDIFPHDKELIRQVPHFRMEELLQALKMMQN